MAEPKHDHMEQQALAEPPKAKAPKKGPKELDFEKQEKDLLGQLNKFLDDYKLFSNIPFASPFWDVRNRFVALMNDKAAGLYDDKPEPKPAA